MQVIDLKRNSRIKAGSIIDREYGGRSNFRQAVKKGGIGIGSLRYIDGIDADCGGSMACATCHVYVGENWTNKIEKIQDSEQDMLDMAYEPKKNSRLSCQIIVTNDLDGLEVTTPLKQT